VQTSQLGRLNLSSIVALIERQQSSSAYKERQLIQQQERQHNLDLLGHESNPALKKTIEDINVVYSTRAHTPHHPNQRGTAYETTEGKTPDLG